MDYSLTFFFLHWYKSQIKNQVAQTDLRASQNDHTVILASAYSNFSLCRFINLKRSSGTGAHGFVCARTCVGSEGRGLLSLK